jgi:hypothetical protein
MPRYHFHAQDGAPLPDREGIDLPDDGAAQVAAVRYLSELVETYPRLLWETRNLQLTVTDARGLMLFRLNLEATLSAAMRGSGSVADRSGSSGG